MNVSHIIDMVISLYGINITPNVNRVAKRKYTERIIKEYGLDPANSSCDKLLKFFRVNGDISFLSVTHSLDSGFVTTQKSKGLDSNTHMVKQECNVDANSISNDDVKCWRNELKNEDEKQILVAIAWIHD